MTQYQQTKNFVEARQGEATGRVRTVLVVSTFLAIAALGAVYLWFIYAH